VSGGAITIRPKLEIADQEHTPAQRRAINRGIAASEKDYKVGRLYGPFKTHEAFVESLHAEAAKLRKKGSKRTAKHFLRSYFRRRPLAGLRELALFTSGSWATQAK